MLCLYYNLYTDLKIIIHRKNIFRRKKYEYVKIILLRIKQIFNEILIDI